MRRLFGCTAMCAVALSWAAPAALAQFYQQRSQFAPAPSPQVNSIRFHSRPALPAEPAKETPASAPPVVSQSRVDPGRGRDHGSHHQHDHHGHWQGGGLSPWVFWNNYPIVWSGAFIGPVTPYVPVQPLVAPPPAGAPLPAPRDAVQQPAAQDPRPAAEPKATNAETRARSGKFVVYGDAKFGKQKYLAAFDRYKTAAGIAADLPEAVFRQGFALVALGQYENAAKTFRRGLRVRPDWPASGFRLADLYGDDRLAKTAHLESLAKAVEANPFDSDVLVTLAIALYFDGQHDRAQLCFARAVQLGGNEDRLLDGFLPKPAPADAPKNPAGKVVF